MTQILSTYNPARHSINEHALEILSKIKIIRTGVMGDEMSVFSKTNNTAKTNKTANSKASKRSEDVPILSEEQRHFILSVVCGVVENHHLLNCLQDLLYVENSNLNPRSKICYSICFYYVFFVLKDGNFK